MGSALALTSPLFAEDTEETVMQLECAQWTCRPRRWFAGVFVLFVMVTCAAAQQPPRVGEGSLLYSTPDQGYVALPLLHTDVRLEVQGLVASATVTQQYANSSDVPLEAVYVFPLPHDAAVYDLEIHIGDRVIRSTIKERAEAKKVYAAAKAQGQHAALLEQERPNIFTTSVANLMPGDRIEVRLRYVEPLEWENGRLRLVFPMVVGPRYIPGTKAVGHKGTGLSLDTDAVPDASRITPALRAPESRSGHDISLRVELDPGFGSASVDSVSHQVNLQRLSGGRQRVELSTGATIPNKDFILEVKQNESREPQTAIFLSSPGSGGDTHFLLATYPPTVAPSEPLPVEMLYMIDVSGSMEGASIEQAREALLRALSRLRPEDRFAILQFSSGYSEFQPVPVEATSQNLANARAYVRSLRANGGTEMLPALLHLMQKPTTPGYLRHIVLLTDGALGNEEEIFEAMRSHLGQARLHTVGIGSAPNVFLATKMAQYGRGTFTHISSIAEIEQQMTSLFEKLENPVLTDVNLSFDGLVVEDVYPSRAADLYLHQPLLVTGRIVSGEKGTLHVTATGGHAFYQRDIPIDTAQAGFHPGVTTLWARQRVEELMDGWRRASEQERASVRSQIVEHAIRYHLVTKFTSLVAVEQVVVNPGGQSATAAVRTELPEGWKLEGVTGVPATGTADDFLQMLGLALLAAGAALALLLRRKRVLA
jgi:Ca-activated chloride channel family protein